MKRFASVVVLLAGVILIPAYAQDTDTLPILNFEDYAASDRVTLVETLPIFWLGEDQNTLLYSDGDEWITAPFPEGSRYSLLNPIVYNYQQPDSSYLLFSAHPFHASFTWQHMPIEFLWRFDPETQTIARPEAFCGHLKPIYGDEGVWVIDEREDTSEIYLCNTETETEILISPAIAGFSSEANTAKLCEYDFFFGLTPPLPSPDGRYVALGECFHNGDTGSVYVYDTATEEFILLGTTPHSHAIYTVRWMDNERFLVMQEGGEYFEEGNTVYIADVNASADSLTMVGKHATMESVRGLYSDEDYIISSVTQSENTITFTRHFVETGESQMLYTADCDEHCGRRFFESNYDFIESPERELVLLPFTDFNDDGSIDVTVMEVASGDRLHTVTSKENGPHWVSAHTLRTTVDNRVEYTTFTREGDGYAVTIEVYEKDFYRSDVNLPPDFVSPQQGSALIWIDDQIGVYDFETGEEIPIFAPGDDTVLVFYSDDDTGTIDVIVAGENLPLAYWRIRVEFDQP